MSSKTSILLLVGGSSIEILLKMLGHSLGILILVCSLEELSGKKRVTEGGAFPDIIFCM